MPQAILESFQGMQLTIKESLYLSQYLTWGLIRIGQNQFTVKLLQNVESDTLYQVRKLLSDPLTLPFTGDLPMELQGR